jgi:hypothetical protein
VQISDVGNLIAAAIAEEASPAPYKKNVLSDGGGAACHSLQNRYNPVATSGR